MPFDDGTLNTIIDSNEVDITIYLPERPRRISLLRVDNSSLSTKIEVNNCFDFSTV